MLQQAVALLFYKTFVFELVSSCGNRLAKVLLGILGLFGVFEVFVTILVVYEYVVYYRSIASLGYGFSCYKTVFVRVEQFGNLLQVQFKFQKYRVTKFG